MARYKLIANPNGCDSYEVENQRKSTKSEIHKWIEDNTKSSGFDWRVGYLIKFRDSPTIYEWLNIRDDSTVKF